LDLPLLASLPIDLVLRESGDRCEPLVATQPDAPSSRAFAQLAERVAQGLGLGSPL
jgi:ATP-binding protein involved in chromosome partitioning